MSVETNIKTHYFSQSTGNRLQFPNVDPNVDISSDIGAGHLFVSYRPTLSKKPIESAELKARLLKLCARLSIEVSDSDIIESTQSVQRGVWIREAILDQIDIKNPNMNLVNIILSQKTAQVALS